MKEYEILFDTWSCGTLLLGLIAWQKRLGS